VQRNEPRINAYPDYTIYTSNPVPGKSTGILTRLVHVALWTIMNTGEWAYSPSRGGVAGSNPASPT
jgi:hypothetical protein